MKGTTKKDKVDLTFENYLLDKIIYRKYTIPELKKVCKEHKLHVTGRKDILIERIDSIFIKMKNAIIIQKNFRKIIALNWLSYKGSALKNRKICNNNTDFVTMEPIDEIDMRLFFSYTDKKKFTYGFDITSLIHCYYTTGKLKNPYTRENMDKNVLDKIITVFKITCILYNDFKEQNDKYTKYKKIHRIPVHSIRARRDGPFNYRPRFNPNAFRDLENRTRWERIVEIRRRPIQDRIENLFIEIDLLGNYTQSSWFNNLNYNQLVRFFRFLNDIWNFRSGMTHTTKINICPFYNPFDNIFPTSVDLNYSILKTGCLTVFENFVYAGISEDFRKIGCLHALSSLTLVSEQARHSLPWLYDSVALT